MSHLRFNHVFSALMLAAALAAFVVPPRVSAPAQAHLQVLFVPVARPIYALSGWTHDRVVKDPIRDDGSPSAPRDVREIVRENNELREQLLTITRELEHLKELDADRSKLGDLRARCVVVQVSGFDSGQAESILLANGTKDGLRQDQPVLCPNGVLGKLNNVGIASARVRMITDKGNRVKVSFVRFEKDEKGQTKMTNVSYPDCIAIGQGGGRMLITHQHLNEIEKIVQPNDWAVLHDPDWSGLAYRVGCVSAVQPQPGAVGFGQVEIESLVDAKSLREVMVLTK